MMMLVTALAALVAASYAAGVPFPESRLITTPQHGALLNSWANQTANQEWKLCYSSFTMDTSTPAEFHKRCDQYKPTFTVAKNAGESKPGKCQGKCYYCDACVENGTPCSTIGSKCTHTLDGDGSCEGSCSIDESGCSVVGSACGPTNVGNFTFGGFADATWSGGSIAQGAGVHKGTAATFIFGLGPGQPQRFEPKFDPADPGRTSFQWVYPGNWPVWGQGPDLTLGCATAGCEADGSGSPPGSQAVCFSGVSYQSSDGKVGDTKFCGGDLDWGKTDVEVWRKV